jgi:hypothetical protein
MRDGMPNVSRVTRPIQRAGRAPDIVLTEVRERLAALLEDQEPQKKARGICSLF